MVGKDPATGQYFYLYAQPYFGVVPMNSQIVQVRNQLHEKSSGRIVDWDPTRRVYIYITPYKQTAPQHKRGGNIKTRRNKNRKNNTKKRI
jgi:hypothetical protein